MRAAHPVPAQAPRRAPRPTRRGKAMGAALWRRCPDSGQRGSLDPDPKEEVARFRHRSLPTGHAKHARRAVFLHCQRCQPAGQPAASSTQILPLACLSAGLLLGACALKPTTPHSPRSRRLLPPAPAPVPHHLRQREALPPAPSRRRARLAYRATRTQRKHRHTYMQSAQTHRREPEGQLCAPACARQW
jgi:hypothetical protein